MVPPELRVKRSKSILKLAPEGTSWCAACQTFRDDEDFRANGTMCRACSSAKSHAAMIEKTYGLTSSQYDQLLKLQGGKCAICRARPKSKRLAVDHDHQTGAVLGLLCSNCNHDLKGSAWDSLAMATALWHYMNTPPATGAWIPPENAPQLEAVGSSQRPSKPSNPAPEGLVVNATSASARGGKAGKKGKSVEAVFTPADTAAGILAGLALEPPVAHALWGALDRHLRRVDPAPF